ncbi:hypothetical protein [Paenibacillus thiaminolyticus]|nr:hypothetical protein [Paenibacillus thiaminolyticus]
MGEWIALKKHGRNIMIKKRKEATRAQNKRRLFLVLLLALLLMNVACAP